MVRSSEPIVLLVVLVLFLDSADAVHGSPFTVHHSPKLRTPLALNLLPIAIMICFQTPKLLISSMPERTQKPPTPVPWEPKQGGGEGPRSPDVSKPDTKDLLKRMRKVDPNQSKRYRQRTGE